MTNNQAVNNDNPKVTIIVPVYNAEKYIERCARSIFEQTYKNLEIIFVDDCTPDNSMVILQEIIDKYPNRKDQTHIIKHETNQGSATSRNSALRASTGEYIMYCDSDDWMDCDNVEHLLGVAQRGGHDIVYCDYNESFLNGDKLIRQDFGTDRLKCIIAMFTSKMHCATWNKIFKRSLYFNNDIFFVDGADMHEDVGVNIRIFAVANAIGYLPETHYHYNQCNQTSIIATYTNKDKSRKSCLQRIKNVETAVNFLRQHNVWTKAIQSAAADCELRAKDDLISDTTYSLKKWIVTFPDADKAIWSSPYLTLNMRFLFTWLHFHQIWMYKLQKRITGLLNK